MAHFTENLNGGKNAFKILYLYFAQVGALQLLTFCILILLIRQCHHVIPQKKKLNLARYLMIMMDDNNELFDDNDELFLRIC